MLFFLALSCGIYLVFIIFIISGLFRHSVLDISSSQELPKVSVIIAARNEEEHLPYLIQDIVNQEYPIDKIETIIVDDRSTDLTSDIIKEASEAYSFIKHITIHESNPHMTPKKHAITVGIEASEGEVIVATDADCRVGKLWVSSMVYNVIKKDSIAIGYSSISGSSFFEQYQMIDFLGILSANAGAAGWGQFWSGSGQNLAYYKKDFNLIDGFTPVKEKLSGDDMYLVQSISKHKNGFINIDPNSFVTTAPMHSAKEFLNQRSRWSSNSRENITGNKLFFSFLVSSFLFNVFLVFSALFGSPWLLFFFIKSTLDGLVLFLGAKLFNTKINLIPFIYWSFIQPIYIPIVAVLGLFNRYSWKK